MTEIKIEKSIPIPTPRYGFGVRKHNYPFADLQVGDSFFVPGVKNLLGYAPKDAKGCLTTRTVTENGVKGQRIWRTK